MSEQQTYLAPDVVPRLAAIDIGSNSIRLVVAEAQAGGRYRILDEERETTRLGRSLAAHGDLDAKSIEDSLTALRRFKSIVTGFGVESFRSIATCAVREATNGAEFCRRMQDELGLEIEIIDADMEAHLAFESVRRRFDLAGKNTVLADIGGGSTEIVLANGELVEAVYATQLGAVRLAEKYGGELTTDEQFLPLKRWIDRELRQTTEKPAAPLHLLIGSGGTFTSLASMLMAGRGLSRLPAAGYRASRADVCHLIDRLRKMKPEERKATPGLNADRTDIIIPGLAVIDALMRRFRVNTLQVHAYGVRDGLLLTMIDQMQGTSSTSAPSHDEQIDRFAEACGVNMIHSRHVAKLAGEIFAGLAQLYELPPGDRRLLEVAARLQDVGYLINYEGHHKHSYHLILHSRLEGFRPEELEIIANVARYHRGSPPKKKHENFSELTEPDRLRVRQLAAILRIAGGLDRSHNQTIREVKVDGAPGQVVLTVSANEYPEVDVWACRRRAELFEEIFTAKLTVQWAGQSITAEITAPPAAANGAAPTARKKAPAASANKSE
ncbi:HD domain-containing protein [Lacipirellula sp.]|uniref:Ppx/GppA phosphatase family protein n=1 Tax=Lacipirellula sp. TaxID=2691419 RepID=UPI003D0FB095